jgi:hypothetical protein
VGIERPRPLVEVMLKTIVSALAGASLLCLALPAAAQSHRGAASHDGWSRGGAIGAPAPAAVASPAAPASGGHWNGSNGSHWSGSNGVPRGGFDHGGLAGGRPFGGDHFHHHFRGFPVFVSGFSLGLGFAAFDPWFYGPYYGFYEPYPYYAWGYAPYPEPVAPPSYYTPPRSAAAPPAADTPSAPAACGSWVWDSDKQVYNWAPCAT